MPASSESLVSGSLQTRPQKHKKMLHHIRAAGPLPHSHPSPWRPSLQALGPPIWAVSAGRSHPELSEWMLLASTPIPGWSSGCGQGLWPWIALPWASVTPGSPLEPWGKEKETEHRAPTSCRRSSRRRVCRCANELQAERPVLSLLLWDPGQAPSLSGISAASGQAYLRDH